MKVVKMTRVLMVPRRLNEERHLLKSKEADLDKLADMETSPPMIYRSNGERPRNTRIAGYHTPNRATTSEDLIGCGDNLIMPMWQ